MYVVDGRIDKSMEGLKHKLETAHKASGGRKVNLVSHSMGGIMISCFMSLHRDVCIIFLNDLLKCLYCNYREGTYIVTTGCFHCSLAGVYEICE